MTRLTVFLVLLSSALFAHRDVWAMTGTQLQEMCSQGSKDSCSSYIAGVRDAAQQIDPQGRPIGLFITSPYAWCYTREEPVTADREVRTLLSWFRDHADALGDNAARLIAHAFADNFKCNGGASGAGDAGVGDQEEDDGFIQ